MGMNDLPPLRFVSFFFCGCFWETFFLLLFSLSLCPLVTKMTQSTATRRVNGNPIGSAPGSVLFLFLFLGLFSSLSSTLSSSHKKKKKKGMTFVNLAVIQKAKDFETTDLKQSSMDVAAGVSYFLAVVPPISLHVRFFFLFFFFCVLCRLLCEEETRGVLTLIDAV